MSTLTTDPATHRPDEILLGFARALRAAGLAVTQDRAMGFLTAAAHLGLHDRRGLYVGGRATLCSGPEDLPTYDRVFHAWFDAREPLPGPTTRAPAEPSLSDFPATLDDGGSADESASVAAVASATEVLRHRDIAALEAVDRQRLAAMFATLVVRLPRRRTARREPWHRGSVDAHRTLRRSLRRMGEPSQIAWRRRRTRQRRVVLLVDVSGSMKEYADALLRLAHRVLTRAEPGSVEVFTLGTRLTRVTHGLRLRDVDRALVVAGETVPDWSGGTRLGETMKAFLDRWNSRARGAVVVVFSDGWERGDPALLAEQLARLQRLAHRVVWVNPHRGKPGYQPVQQGVLAVLPHVDDFVAGHSLATFAELLEVLADA